jgi:D-aminopeptidase
LMEALQHQVPFPSGTMNLYARGLRIDSWRGVHTVSHGGLWPGYRTEFLRAPSHDCSVIAITNRGDADPAALAHQVLDVLLEGKPDIHPVAALPPRMTLEPMAGRWIEPDSGMTLDIRIQENGDLAAVSYGTTVHPMPAPDGRLAVTHGTVLLAIRAIAEDRLEIEQDAGHTKVWRRVAATGALPSGLDGVYHSPEMACHWTISTQDGSTCVHVEGPLLRATTWNTEPVETDVVRVLVPGILSQSWFDVRLLREQDRVSGLQVNTGRLRNVVFDRVDDSHAR